MIIPDHQLVHAKHLTNGTWRCFDPSGRAIEEEFIHCTEIAGMNGIGGVDLRATKKGLRVWWQRI